MLKSLRESEEVILYQNILKISAEEKKMTTDFLQEAYTKEELNYPNKAPEFDALAAIWAAEVVYLTAQLILYRKDEIEALAELFKSDHIPVTASSMLSTDLCLRFVPDMLIELKMIDPEDQLIEVLEGIMKKWHYSAINYQQEVNDLNLDAIAANQCLKQLYLNRIVLKRNIKLAELDLFNQAIHGNLGIYQKEYWPDFKLNEKNE
ncbi:MAG: hypothetical protein GQ574_04510 [Crocinitomix sp.]|nr:hypothetical protein [Crocinitomix sp.]